MGNTIGIDPDKDYLFDPQQRETFPGRCDCCGHLIQRGDRFYRLELCMGLLKALHMDELTICQDCKAELDSTEAEWVGIRYGA